MTLYRFTKRSYLGERLIEPGEVLNLPDDTVPGDHMVDVAAEEAGTVPVPGSGPMRRPAFRADLAQNLTPQGILGMPPRLATESDAQWAERVHAWERDHPDEWLRYDMSEADWNALTEGERAERRQVYAEDHMDAPLVRATGETDAAWAERQRVYASQHPAPSLAARAASAFGMRTPTSDEKRVADAKAAADVKAAAEVKAADDKKEAVAAKAKANNT